MKKSPSYVVGLAILAFGAVACQPLVLDEVRPASPAPAANMPELVAAAGMPVSLPGPETAQLTVDEARNRYFPYRSDVFALLTSERKFEQDQMAERLITEGGGFSLYYEQPDEESEPPPPTRVPVPLWRLAGVVLSNGVVALAEIRTTQGSQYVDLRPGTIITVGDVQWQVVSIDEERAVVKRLGPGPVQYEEIKLTDFAGLGQQSGGGSGNQGGGPPPPGVGSQGGGGNQSSGQAQE
jgi:hypothetical protein